MTTRNKHVFHLAVVFFTMANASQVLVQNLARMGKRLGQAMAKKYVKIMTTRNQNVFHLAVVFFTMANASQVLAQNLAGMGKGLGLPLLELKKEQGLGLQLQELKKE